MGNCGSAPAANSDAARAEKAQSRAVDAAMAQQQASNAAVNKLLLLGAGESGKSTLFKQMVQIYGPGFSEAERKSYLPIIYSNIISVMKTLITQSNHYSPIPTDSPLYASKVFIETEMTGEEEVDAKLAAHFKALWFDPNIQSTYSQRSNYQLTDSAKYFFDRLDAITAKDYIPTQQDILRSRVRTTGIVEMEFAIDGNIFKLFDVGGQRNERKKWIHCFESVTAVLFVAAINEYDQVLYEDEQTNRITESLNLFEEICNSRWFRDTSIILFLNKRDLFSEKITRVPLGQYFPDYTGDGSYESSASYMRELFESKNRNPDKQIYTHVTCATDTENVHAVFNAVKDIIIRRSLNEAGLV